ncbi:MAG TPA: glutamate--tRNA ligase [Smithella sp.]|nr:glutamate--tRNA ligase [Smithella sp.]HRS97849.1 glutamate--tRNA ligase [Smithella sp.]
MTAKPRVRFAPSPTGELHVGNARTALFNWLFARHFRGTFILRIEDTDESRSHLSYQNSLLEDLKWLGLDWEEGPDKEGLYGPYKQSERLHIYKDHLKLLLEKDLVYPCYCTEAELEEERQNLILSKKMPRYMGKCRVLTAAEREKKEAEGKRPTYRFKIHPQSIEFNDLIRGPMKFEADTMGDFIVIRSNGMPAYNFAVVIDDHLMNITHVIRGEDHLSNTALQMMLYRAFDFTPPKFAHHSLILGKDRSKLSKRHGSVTVGEFRKQGILPEALLNYLGLLGSSFADAREIVSKDEMIAEFRLEKASKSGAVFDEEKLYWLNAHYIRKCPSDVLLEKMKPFLKKFDLELNAVTSEWLINVISLIKHELTTLSEVADHIDIFFDDQYQITTEAKMYLENEPARMVIREFSRYLQNAQGEESDIYASAIKHCRDITKKKGKELFMPIRAALTGRLYGPELDRLFVILGKETALKRLKPFTA